MVPCSAPSDLPDSFDHENQSYARPAQRTLQMQNYGGSTYPEEKKRGQKMVTQGWIAIGIATAALIVALIALFRTH